MSGDARCDPANAVASWCEAKFTFFGPKNGVGAQKDDEHHCNSADHTYGSLLAYAVATGLAAVAAD